jgi:Protein of unknown function (DUF2800)
MNVPAHSQFGGSVAARVLRCPASVGLIARVPVELRKVSAYAERGTALHTAMSLLIERERSLDQLVGETLNGYTITVDDVDLSLRPVHAYVDALLDQPGAQYYLETRVTFPTIAGAFGTADLIIRIGTRIYLLDFKFGIGVKVLALYPDGDTDVINGQLMFYAVGARHSLREFFAGVDEIVLTILQPLSTDEDAEMASATPVTQAELDAFIELYRAACEESQGPNPRLKKGNHCRFCPALPGCPEHTKALLDLAQFTLPTRSAFGSMTTSKEDYLRLLSEGLALVDAIKDLKTALHDQAKLALESGDDVPGYALSKGRTVRDWHDERTAFNALLGLGLDRSDLIDEQMRSVKQIELRAKATRGIKIPSELVSSHHSGVSLVKSENARAPVPGRGAIAKSFSQAIQTFMKKG